MKLNESPVESVSNMNILVIGGTGTLGTVLVPKLFSSFPTSRIRILSRDEHKQIKMDQSLQDPRIDYMIGDVRDAERVWLASRGCEMVFNLAAVKSVDKVEYDPDEAVKTNIIGSQNVVKAALRNGIPKAIFTSTDKAVEPVNVYGTTKLAAERIFVTSNSYSGLLGPRFSAVRYGNVLGSNGSVIPKWTQSVNKCEPLKITDPTMTRFWILIDKAADFVIQATKQMNRGEVFIPKMKSCSMIDLANAFDSTKEIQIIGKRPGEKMHEKLFGQDELDMVTQTKDLFIRWPLDPKFPIEKYGEKVTQEHTSFNAERFTQEELKAMLETL